MKIIVDNACILWKDALDLLYMAANQDIKKAEERLGRFQKMFEGHGNAIQSEMEMRRLAQKIEKTEELNYFFEEFEKDRSECVAYAMIYTFVDEKGMSFQEMKKQVESRFFSYSLESFPFFRSVERRLMLKKERRPFIESVREMEIEEKFQARLLFSFAEFDKSMDRILCLMEQAAKLLKPLQEKTKEEAKSFQKYWEGQENLEALLTEVGIYIEASKYQAIRMIPLSVNRAGTRILIEEEEGESERENEELTVEIGLGIDREVMLGLSRPEQYDKRLLLDALKLLSDTTKLEILLYIKEEAHYGKEIADKLHLSAATISYHMEELWQHKLTIIRQEGKRLYYGLNRERVAGVLDEAKRLFLDSYS